MQSAFVCVKGTVVNRTAESEGVWECLPGIAVSTRYKDSDSEAVCSNIITDFFGNFSISEVIDEPGKRMLIISFANDDKGYHEEEREIPLYAGTNFQNTSLLVRLRPKKMFVHDKMEA